MPNRWKTLLLLLNGPLKYVYGKYLRGDNQRSCWTLILIWSATSSFKVWSEFFGVRRICVDVHCKPVHRKRMECIVYVIPMAGWDHSYILFLIQYIWWMRQVLLIHSYMGFKNKSVQTAVLGRGPKFQQLSRTIHEKARFKNDKWKQNSSCKRESGEGLIIKWVQRQHSPVTSWR